MSTSRLSLQVTSMLKLRQGTKRKGKELQFRCFYPENHNHGDQTPSASWNQAKGVWRCNGCQAQGGTIDAARLLGIPIEEAALSEDKPQGCTLKQLAEAKGLKVKTLEGLGWKDSEYKGAPAVDMGGKLRIALTGKGNEKFRAPEGTPSKCLHWGVGPDVLIVEGETDFATCVEHNIRVICVPGSNAWDSGVVTSLVPENAVYIWKEPDKGGEEFVKNIIPDIPSARIMEAPPGAKDITELAQLGQLDKLQELKDGALPSDEYNRPVVTKTPTSYGFAWPNGVTATVTRIREHHDMVTGELEIKRNSQRYNDPLVFGTLNLSSMQTKQRLIGDLDKQCPDTSWHDVISTIAGHILMGIREGEPVMAAGCEPIEARAKAAIRDVWQDGSLLVADNANLLYGEGGAGKTTLACCLGLLAQQGGIGGTLGLEAVEQYNTLICDYEQTFQDINEMLQEVATGLIIKKEELSPEITVQYRRMYQAFPYEIDRIQRVVQELDIRLLIIDSLGSACGGEPENAGLILDYFNALRSLGITTLTIDHTNREGLLFGSIYKFHQARSVWEIKKTQRPGENTLNVGLFHRKINRGKILKPIALKYTYDMDSVLIERLVPETVEGLMGAATTADLIAEVLTEQGPMTCRDIAAATGEAYPNITKTVNRHSLRFERMGRLIKLRS